MGRKAKREAGMGPRSTDPLSYFIIPVLLSVDVDVEVWGDKDEELLFFEVNTCNFKGFIFEIIVSKQIAGKQGGEQRSSEHRIGDIEGWN